MTKTPKLLTREEIEALDRALIYATEFLYFADEDEYALHPDTEQKERGE